MARAAIYMRVTVNGKRAEISAGRECEPSRWNARSGRGIGTKEDTRTLNAYLESLQAKVKAAQQALIDTGKMITAESLRDQFMGKEEKCRYLMLIFDEHNANVAALIGNGFEANTLKGYKTTKNHLEGYLQKQYKKTDIEITLLNHAFVTGFEFYLKTTCNCSGVTAAKYIKNLKKIVNLCLANSWLKANPFINYKNSAKAKERLFLTQPELDIMANKKLSIDRLKQVRDIFIFCCYTGLSYADVKKLKRSEIGIGMDGEKWIFTSRQKTDTSSRIPLLPAALDILDRYSDNPQCENKDLILPVLTNQKMNAYLAPVKVA